jgi:Fic family protein
MARKTPPEAFAAIEAAVRKHPKGASMDDIAKALPDQQRRALQDRVRRLVEAGRLVKSGDRRWTRYSAARAPAPEKKAEPAPPSQRAFLVPLSKESAAVERHVRQPLGRRKPVGYDRSFLDAYRPNKKFYLPLDARRRLMSQGRSATPNQPAGTYARVILSRLLIDLAWNSSRLEGNTYSLLDTHRLIELGQAAEGKDAKDALMILNHKMAIEFLVDSAEEIAFDPPTILNLHAILADGLLADPTAPGRLRRIEVAISGTTYHPLDLPAVIEERFAEVLRKANAIKDPFEQAFFAMVHLPYLQPFDDVNKRVSRLAANIPLIKGNLSPISFTDVPDDAYVHGIIGVYELNQVELLRDVFLWAYERSADRYAAQQQTLAQPDAFRLKHRAALQELVGEIIRSRIARARVSAHIARWTDERIAQRERARFRDMAEAEIIGIGEGNFARYRVRPSEYYAWRQAWDS